jgi:hypothetical protein
MLVITSTAEGIGARGSSAMKTTTEGKVPVITSHKYPYSKNIVAAVSRMRSSRLFHSRSLRVSVIDMPLKNRTGKHGGLCERKMDSKGGSLARSAIDFNLTSMLMDHIENESKA